MAQFTSDGKHQYQIQAEAAGHDGKSIKYSAIDDGWYRFESGEIRFLKAGEPLPLEAYVLSIEDIKRVGNITRVADGE